jgi:hypothetical protein
MKTLARPEDAAEMVRRIRTVRPESRPRWGRMTAHQMMCHLSDAYRMAMNRKPVSMRSSWLERTVVKWIVLYVPLTWPSGIPTRPELDQAIGGTPPIGFDRDVAELESLIETFRTITEGWPPHPIFGRLSHRQWLRWGYLHSDHHLRQFGC